MSSSVAFLLFDHDTIVGRTGHPKVDVKVTASCYLIRDCHLKGREEQLLVSASQDRDTRVMNAGRVSSGFITLSSVCKSSKKHS